MDLQINLTDTQVEQLATRMFQMISPEKNRQDGLCDWIRAEDFYKEKIFSKTTMNKFYNMGLIGKSTVGNMTFYRVSDIANLLSERHVKKEAVERISHQLRKAS